MDASYDDRKEDRAWYRTFAFLMGTMILVGLSLIAIVVWGLYLILKII